MMSPR